MEKDRDIIISLYDLYEELLTIKQKRYFEDYYFLDLSLSEIAENYDISRNGVYDQIKRVVHILEGFEDKLGLYKKIKQIEDLNVNDDIKEEIINIIKE